jgi:glucose-1-phosphate adenylyltransferase
LYENFWKIYTNTDFQPPQYTGSTGEVKTSIISEGCQVYGKVEHSVISKNVIIEEGAVVRDSIIMEGCKIGKNAVLDRCIVDQKAVIGDNVTIGSGENVPNQNKPKIYNTGISVIGSDTVVPDNINIGKNCVIYGITTAKDYVDNKLESGESVILEGAIS